MHKLLLFGISLAMGWLEFDLVFFTMGAWIFQLLLLFSFYLSFVTSTGSVSQVSFKQDSSTSSLKKPFGARLPGKSTSIQTHSMGKTHWRLCKLCLQKIKCKKRVFNYSVWSFSTILKALLQSSKNWRKNKNYYFSVSWQTWMLEEFHDRIWYMPIFTL